MRGIFAVLSIFFALFFRNRTTVLGLLLCIAGVIALFTDPPHFFLTGVGLLALGLAIAGWGYWSTRGR